MKVIIRSISLFILSVLPNILYAQDANPAKVEMADLLHQNGKIYLVVLVLLTIFAGIIFMLVRIEKKLNRLEKNKQV